MRTSTTPPIAAAMVVPGLKGDKKKSKICSFPELKQIQIKICEKVAHPVLLSTGHPRSSITVQLK